MGTATATSAFPTATFGATNANFYNVKDYGVVGSGADETAAIQAVINLVPSGGTILFPYSASTYTFTTLTIDHPITIRGSGWNMSQNSAGLGSANWATATGTVLKSTATSGNSILLGKTGENTYQYNLRDIAIIGPGSGTSVGVLFGPDATSGGTRANWSNVLIGNFSKGLSLSAVENSGFYDLRIGGCGTGLFINSVNCAANWFYGIDVQSCTNVGVDNLIASAGNSFIGGLFQGNFAYSVKMAGTGNRIAYCWFENLGATGDDILLSNATDTIVGYNLNFKAPIRVTGASSGINQIFGNSANSGTPGSLLVEASVPTNTVIRDNTNFSPYTDSTGKAVTATGDIYTSGYFRPISGLILAGDHLALTADGLNLKSGGINTWSNSSTLYYTIDTGISRLAAGGLAVGNGTAGDFSGTIKTAQTIVAAPDGSTWIKGYATELLTLSTSGTTTNTSANLLPANSVIKAVVARVTTTITTATDWKLGDATTAGRFTAADATMTAGETQVGLVHIDQTGAAGPRQTTADKVRVTTTGTPGAGVIRITVYYEQFVAPTS